MKHGDKAKKTAQAVKASAKKSSGKEALAKASSQSGKSKTISKEAGKEAAGKKNISPTPVKTIDAKGGNGKTKAADTGGFNNPLVGAAFKRAVKKYSNAFRRLTD